MELPKSLPQLSDWFLCPGVLFLQTDPQTSRDGSEQFLSISESFSWSILDLCYSLMLQPVFFIVAEFLNVTASLISKIKIAFYLINSLLFTIVHKCHREYIISLLFVISIKSRIVLWGSWVSDFSLLISYSLWLLPLWHAAALGERMNFLWILLMLSLGLHCSQFTGFLALSISGIILVVWLGFFPRCNLFQE